MKFFKKNCRFKSGDMIHTFIAYINMYNIHIKVKNYILYVISIVIINVNRKNNLKYTVNIHVYKNLIK